MKINIKSNRHLLEELKKQNKTMPWWMIEEISNLKPSEYIKWLNTTDPELCYSTWEWNLKKPQEHEPPAVLNETNQEIWQDQYDKLTLAPKNEGDYYHKYILSFYQK